MLQLCELKLVSRFVQLSANSPQCCEVVRKMFFHLQQWIIIIMQRFCGRHKNCASGPLMHFKVQGNTRGERADNGDCRGILARVKSKPPEGPQTFNVLKSKRCSPPGYHPSHSPTHPLIAYGAKSVFDAFFLKTFEAWSYSSRNSGGRNGCSWLSAQIGSKAVLLKIFRMI